MTEYRYRHDYGAKVGWTVAIITVLVIVIAKRCCRETCKNWKLSYVNRGRKLKVFCSWWTSLFWGKSPWVSSAPLALNTPLVQKGDGFKAFWWNHMRVSIMSTETLAHWLFAGWPVVSWIDQSIFLFHQPSLSSTFLVASSQKTPTSTLQVRTRWLRPLSW